MERNKGQSNVRVYDKMQKSVPDNQNNYLCSYDLYSPVDNVLDVCISIMRASVGSLNSSEFFGPCEMASSQVSAIWGPKISRFPGPNPLPLAHIMDMNALQNIMHRAV
jgi:hypothetical protein